ncbi:hypothetical protein ABTX80_31930 [Streptomyces erythrochromogenes]|uniref:nSTAND1 domain-containing NTPase n=1 Tax=Streptomyces erythrochromogenes TaxID=285574 RepID=UPI00333151B1
MPRPERPLDPDSGPLTRFAADLRTLREAAGRPPYRALAKRAHYSSTTLSDAAGGHTLPSLAVTLAYVEACRGDRRAWEARWHTAAAEIAAGARQEEPAATDHHGAPYAGLAAFQPEDADRFFGREHLTAELLAKVRDRRFLTVFGPSGSGKSSLLRAGLVARTRTAGQPVILFTPGPHPVEECALHLAATTGEAPGPLLAELREDPAALHLRIRQTALGHTPADAPATAPVPVPGSGTAPGTDVLVVVDQFEEVFTLCRDPDERDAFIALLTAAATTPTSRARVVLGVRADFYGHCVQDPRLVEAMRDAQIAVGPMTSQELREAVTRPAALADCTVTGPLLAAVVADATGQPGALPLVSHAMVETWRRRCGSRLTLDGYLAAGGIQHALAHTAEAAYAAFSPAQQDHARSLFLRLTALGDGTEDTRRRITTNELDPGPDTAHVLESLARRRLVTLDDGCVEITHEAIIRCWPRLRGWLTEDRERLLLHRRLTDATADWEAQGHDPHALYRGARLAAALDLAAVHDSRLTSRERRFLDAARAAQADETAAARRRTVRLRRLVALLTVLVAVAATAGGLAVDSRDSAIRQRNVAIARKAAADAAEVRQHDPALAAQLNLAAHRLAAGSRDVRDQLMSTFATPYTSRLTGHTSDVVSLSVGPDSTLLATASWDRTARLWDITDARHPVQLAAVHRPERLVSVAFDGTGRVLATADERSVRLWDVTNRRAPAELAALPAQPSAAPSWVAYGPGGSGVLATGHTDGTTRLWNAGDPRRPRLLATLPGHTAAVTSVAFSPDRHTMATTGDTTTRLWDVDDPANPLLLDVLRGHTDTVTSAAFSPDGRTLATGGWDRTARVWNLAGGRPTPPPAVLTGHPAIVWSVAFSPDGTALATVGGSTHFWDVTAPARPRRSSTVQGGFYQAAFTPDGRVLAHSDRLLDLRDLSLATHDDVVTSLAFAPGGRLLASASWDGTARLWQVTGGRALWPLAALHGHTRFVRCVTFSPDGRTLVTASEDGTARVWDVTDPRKPRPVSVIAPDGGEVGGTAFAPGGRLLAVWTQAKAGLWDLTDPADPRPLSRIGEDGRHVTTASFRPDGHTLATSTGESGSLRLWDITRPSTPREIPSPLRSEPLTGGVFSPDNRRLAAFHRTDKTIWLIDVHDIHHPARTTRLPASGAWIYALAFDAEGRRLAAGAADSKALLWDLDGPAAPTVLTGHTNPVPAVAFTPDGTTLATGGNDFTIRLRDTRLSAVTARICDHAHPRITEAQWTRHFPALDFTPPCPAP